MSQDNVSGPETPASEDLLSAWRGRVRELETSSAEVVGEGTELLAQLRMVADDLARGPAAGLRQLPASTSEQSKVVADAIIEAEAAPIGDDTAIASPFDVAAVAALAAEFATIRETLAAELHAEIETLRAQTDKLSSAVPVDPAALNAAKEIAALQQSVDASINGLRKDVQTYATAERKNAQAAIAAAEKSIEKLQSRVTATTSDADQRLARLTSIIQAAVDRAERSAEQVQAAYGATDALRAEATSAVGNWREEALRIVRDALARMATETAAAASQAKETRKTVVAETRSLRAELLKSAESAHAAVMTEVRHELQQTRAAFEEQRKQLAAELSALETIRAAHAALASEGERLRNGVDRLNVEADRVGAQVAPLAAARQANEELTTSARQSVADALDALQQAQKALDQQHQVALNLITDTHAALSAEVRRELSQARSAFTAQRKELQGEQRRLGAAIDDVVSRAKLELAAAKEAVGAAAAEVSAVARTAGETRSLIAAGAEQLERTLREELESLAQYRSNRAEHEAAALREAAETKRGEDDQAALQRAVAMLSVLESLDDAVRSLENQHSDEARRRIARFEREARAMAQVVELEEIPADGGVDEDRHEIVGVAAEDNAAGAIVEVRQRGYSFRGRVIRRAQVVVSGAARRGESKNARIEKSRAGQPSELTL